MCTKRKDMIQAMVKFATTTAKGEVSTEVLSGSVRTVATLACVAAAPRGTAPGSVPDAGPA